MTLTNGMSLHDAIAAIEKANKGWHVWQSSEGHTYATSVSKGTEGGGITVDAPSVESIEHAIATWEAQEARDQARKAGAA